MRLSAEGRDANGHLIEGTAFSWASSNTAVAPVDGSGLVTAAGNGNTTVTASVGAVSATAHVTVEQKVTDVNVSPSADTLVAFGDTTRISAEARDANGHVIEEAGFSWKSSDASVAPVDGFGLVTATGNGNATVTASAGAVSATARLTVEQRVTDVSVSPPEATLVAFADTVRLLAEARDANGHLVEGAAFSWVSSNTVVAQVDGSGLVTAAGSGNATVTASAGAVSATAHLTVEQRVTDVSVSPPEATLVAFADTVWLLAKARDANGHLVEGAAFSWVSSNTAVAQVDGSGLVTAAGSGNATVTASAGAVSATAHLTVEQRVTDVSVSPPEATLVAFADTVWLLAKARDANGHLVEGAAFSWVSSNTAVAQVDGSGLVTAAGNNGSAMVTASAEAVAASAAVLVQQRVADVSVSPSADTLVAFGDTTRLSAEARDANGYLVEGVVFSWMSRNPRVAGVDHEGMVTGQAAGATTVAARSAGVAGIAAVVVVAPVPTTITVTPDTVDFTALGQSAQLKAEVRDQIGRVMADPLLSWSSGDTRVAVVDSRGRISAAGNGTAEIRATAEAAIARAVVRVFQSVDSVTVSPAADTIAPGDSLRLVAKAFDENGYAVERAKFRWTSNDVQVAVIDGSGLVWGAGVGTATIEAASGQIKATATISVASPDRAVLASFYDAANGASWEKNTNWLSDKPLAEWHGITVDYRERVVELDLSWNGLTGSITPQIGKLAHLRSLSLQVNGLGGSIPPEIGSLKNLLSIDLQSNDLNGQIPAELSTLDRLQTLWLSGNRLTGPIPPQLGNLRRLTSLSLTNNLLSGRIPRELGALERLGSLGLGDNRLGGGIPAGLSLLGELRSLDLCRNILTGPIPPVLGNLTNLEALALGCGTQDTNDFAGGIPPELGSLANLTYLGLAGTGVAGPIPPELSGLKKLELLNLHNNELSGEIPPELGELANLSRLELDRNDLTGPIPRSFLKLRGLVSLRLLGNDICVPGTSGFASWLRRIKSHDEPAFCNAEDVAALESLYEATGGPDWTRSNGWHDGNAVEEWYGVSADSLGRVTELDLSRNGLDGVLPHTVGDLLRMTALRIGANELAGRLPLSLVRISLREFRYADTDLCVPTVKAFEVWLDSIPSHEGTGVKCRPSDRDVLKSLYEETGGPNWTNSENWLSDEPLGDWYGVSVDGEGRVTSLELPNNDLTGTIPPELGNLARLTWLNFTSNDLTGAIPPEIGGLDALRILFLGDNGLTGSIPAELGNLGSLLSLYLWGNNLTGAIPPELGSLEHLRLLLLSDNGEMAGALSHGLTALTRLDALRARNTGLCAPTDPGFQDWLKTVPRRDIANCIQPVAYLTQAVQSRDFDVALVAGEKALLRVFPIAQVKTTEGIPKVRARFYHAGRKTHEKVIKGKSSSIPTVLIESDLAKSANAEIPGSVIQPGLQMVIDIDPDSTLDPKLGATKRIPETGRLEVDVEEMPLFDLTLIPFIWTKTHDSTIVDLVEAMADDPEDHKMLGDTRTLLPIGDLDVTAHDPVLSDTNNAHVLLHRTHAIRAIEGATGHYMGMMSQPVTGGAAGVAWLKHRVSFSIPVDYVIAHELGHNRSLLHAPCGNPARTDPSYPYSDGSIGVWGYDFERSRLVKPSTNDLMSYCGPRWISDYHFDKALRFRLEDEDEPQEYRQPAKSLLLWGGVDADRVPFLEPAFAIDAPPRLPRSGGEYRLFGRTGKGAELFSLTFDMPEMADGDGRSSFAFVLPVEPGWEGNLATITLSGPGGSATLDGDSDQPIVIVRNVRTGRVRAILRDLPSTARTQADAAAAVGSAPGLSVLFSRGIPGADAWK